MGFSQVFDRFATLPPAEVARALDAFRREVAVMASVHSSKVVAARGCCTREPGRELPVRAGADQGGAAGVWIIIILKP